ncbi:MAG: hypothetical protein EON60_02765 [Alphaproteobacteria bacterium]|nr:MAG: hypothetical protein EON60_02765 [Alphaproteobacteria bacterium]
MKQMYLNGWNGLRYGMLALALSFAGAGGADASDYYGGSGNGGGHYHNPTPAPQPSASSGSSSRTYSSSRSYNAHYRQGGSGYGYLNYSRGENTDNGYNGASVSINTPHRGDWQSKLQAQRQWDDMQYRKMQQESSNTARCGLSNPPSYCFRLQGPYPTEMRIVRY